MQARIGILCAATFAADVQQRGNRSRHTRADASTAKYRQQMMLIVHIIHCYAPLQIAYYLVQLWYAE